MYSDFFNNIPENIQLINNPLNNNYLNSILISFSIFLNFNNRAIFLTNSNCILYIEESTFHKCITSSSGSAIYFQCSNGEIVLINSCCSECYTTSSATYGFFLYSEPKTNGLNFIESSSVSNCIVPSPQHDQGCSFFLSKGNQSLISSNISKIFVNRYCGYILRNSYFSKTKFLTILNIKADVTSCLEYQSSNYNISFSNIVNYTQNSNLYIGLFWNYNSNVNFFNNIIVNYNLINLFTSTSIDFKFFISYCYYNIGVISNQIENNNFNYLTNTYNLKHFSTFYCKNNYSFLTTKINTLFLNLILFYNQIIVLNSFSIS